MTQTPVYDTVDKCVNQLVELNKKLKHIVIQRKCGTKITKVKLEDITVEIDRMLEIIQKMDPIAGIELEGTYDEARNMAHTLREIDMELRTCAQCEGDHQGGYPTASLLPNLCKIMYKDFGEFHSSKYN